MKIIIATVIPTIILAIIVNYLFKIKYKNDIVDDSIKNIKYLIFLYTRNGSNSFPVEKLHSELNNISKINNLIIEKLEKEGIKVECDLKGFIINF